MALRVTSENIENVDFSRAMESCQEHSLGIKNMFWHHHKSCGCHLASLPLISVTLTCSRKLGGFENYTCSRVATAISVAFKMMLGYY